jgi:glyoxylase-like metal-dependent hydrolase (beta-lactamase superfamily II)/uncharacterized protein YjbI with pentapeptide repeats
MRRLLTRSRIAAPFLRSQRGVLALAAAVDKAGGGATAVGEGTPQRNLQLSGAHAVQLAGIEVLDSAAEGVAFSGAIGGASWRRCGLGKTSWAAMDGVGASWDAVDLHRSTWTGGHLPHNRFSHCSLREASLADLDLSGTIFVLCDLSGATFTNCQLAGARFVGCDLEGARLQGCDLTDADLGGSSLRNAALVECTLDGVAAPRVDAAGLSGLSAEQRAALKAAGARGRGGLLYGLWGKILGGSRDAASHRRTLQAVGATWGGARAAAAHRLLRPRHPRSRRPGPPPGVPGQLRGRRPAARGAGPAGRPQGRGPRGRAAGGPVGHGSALRRGARRPPGRAGRRRPRVAPGRLARRPAPSVSGGRRVAAQTGAMRARFSLVLAGCGNSSPVDGKQLNSVVTIADFFTSAYLVPHEDGALLVDAGFRPNRIESAVRDAGFEPEEITDVLLTHGHSDHTAALELFTDARVWALPAEAEVLQEEGAAATDWLEDRETRTFGGVAVEVFGVPGHTPGSAMFLADGVLMMGDAAIGQRDGTLGETPARYSDDPAALVASVRAVAAELAGRDAALDFLAPAHSDALTGLQPLLDF